MAFPVFLLNGLWGGLFAGVMGVILTAPPRVLASAFLCGFAGRAARDLVMALGVSLAWSTAAAAAAVVLVAAAILRRHAVSPVVLISSLLPLGAAGSVFRAILGMLKVSSLEGEALGAETVALSANIGKSFTVFLAIALGLGGGLALVRLVRGEKVLEDV